jgi:hypothetical protein
MTAIVTLLTSFSLAQEPNCNKNVQYLRSGTKAPCTGYLFSPKKEFELRFKVSTYDQMEKILNDQNKLNLVLQQRLDNTRNYNEKLINRVNELKDGKFWERAAFFGLGAVLTIIIAKETIQHVR